MPKPTTGRIEPVPPEPDADQMAVDTLMTSVFTGISLLVCTTLLGAAGGLGALVADDLAEGAWKIGLGIGLAVGTGLIALGLRRYRDRIKARSTNLYRGAWIGTFVSLGLIVLMAYFPQVAIPQYCPPGAVCVSNQR